MIGFNECPRCGCHAFESLSTYSHCVSCLYFEDRYLDSESHYFKARLVEREIFGKPAKQSNELQPKNQLRKRSA